MSLTLVQSNSTTYNHPSSTPSTTTVNLAYSSANTAGNLLIAIVTISNGNGGVGNWPPTFSDSAGNTLVTAAAFPFGSAAKSYSAAVVVPSCLAGANTFTCSWTWNGLGGAYNASNQTTIEIFEYSGAGAPALQSGATQPGPSVTSVSVTDSRGTTITLTESGAAADYCLILFDLYSSSLKTNWFFAHTITPTAPGSVTLSLDAGLSATQVMSVHAGGFYSTFFTAGAALAQRGNIDYDQIQAAARKGTGSLIQMAGASSFVSGHVPVFDANGNLIDGGAAPGSGVSDVNGATGSITLTGAGVAQSGNTFTISGSGGSGVFPISSSSSYAFTAIVPASWSAIGSGGSFTTITGQNGGNALRIVGATGGSSNGPFYGVSASVSGTSWTKTFLVYPIMPGTSFPAGYVLVGFTDGTKYEGVALSSEGGPSISSLKNSTFANAGSIANANGTVGAIGRFFLGVAPVLIQLTRSGSTLTGSVSIDNGSNWETIFSDTTPFLTPTGVCVVAGGRGNSNSSVAYFESYQ